MKTVAGGVKSPAGFSTILTGQYVPQHGGWSFDSRKRQDITTVFDLAPNKAFNFGGGALGEVLGTTEIRTEQYDATKAVDEPFVVMERDINTHLSFGAEVPGMDLLDVDGTDTCSSLYRSSRTQTTTGATERPTTTRSAETTTGVSRWHSNASTHSLNEGVTVESDFAAHVDLLPTIASLLEGDTGADYDGPGHDLTTGAPERRLVYNGEENRPLNEWSVWGPDGGYVFPEDGLGPWLVWWVYKLTSSASGAHNRRRPVQTLREAVERAVDDCVKFGDPQFTVEEATEYAEAIRERSVEETTVELDEETMSRLEELGYREQM